MKKRLIIGLLAWWAGMAMAATPQTLDSLMLAAYEREDMSVWQKYVDSFADSPQPATDRLLLYEYGFCGYMVDRDKPHALPYVKRFKAHVEARKNDLPDGHYRMYRSAVYVYELRLHESMHPITAMNLAQEATKKAPEDPLVLSYYGTSLFYAPSPFGSKREALKWFEKAEPLFNAPQWQYCWVRKANEMYIQQCMEKLKK